MISPPSLTHCRSFSQQNSINCERYILAFFFSQINSYLQDCEGKSSCRADCFIFGTRCRDFPALLPHCRSFSRQKSINCKRYVLAFFLKSILISRTVRENLRVVLTVSSLGGRFQKCCRDFPALINTVSVILLPHWDKEALVAHAYHLLKGNR